MTPDTLTTFMAALDTGLGDGANKAIVNAIMLVILAFPLAFTPILMKLMGGIAGQIGAIANNRSKGVFDRVKNTGKNLSGKQTGAWKSGVKGYADRTARGFAADKFNPQRKGWRKAANVPSMLAARQAGFTSRQAILMGQKNEAFEDAEVGMAMKDIEGKGYDGKKDLLKKYVTDNKGNASAQYAGMLKLAKIGADKELGALFANKDTKLLAAKAISSPDSKLKDVAAPLYFEAAGYAGEHKMVMAGGKPGVAPTVANAEAAAEVAGQNLRESKASEQLSQSYILGLKPTQLTGDKYDASKNEVTKQGYFNAATGEDQRASSTGVHGLVSSLGTGGQTKVAAIVKEIHANKRLQERVSEEQKLAFDQILRDAGEAALFGTTAPTVKT